MKLTKEQHNMLTLKDNTVVFYKKLLKNGANPECLKLPSKFTANCNIKLYHGFLNDLARSLKSSKSASQDLKAYVIAKISQITG
ncbi:MAG: hypothetical protein PV340_03135 [Wolbachia sp.]|nr:hypothetical protein [Wolbachia sp.]MDD9336660.1 hypothetical protein [Wolbachia sp.]